MTPPQIDKTFVLIGQRSVCVSSSVEQVSNVFNSLKCKVDLALRHRKLTFFVMASFVYCIYLKTLYFSIPGQACCYSLLFLTVFGIGRNTQRIVKNDYKFNSMKTIQIDN